MLIILFLICYIFNLKKSYLNNNNSVHIKQKPLQQPLAYFLRTLHYTGSQQQSHRPLTLSLEENLMHLGSSLMIFFTSFHVDVKVIFQKKQK